MHEDAIVERLHTPKAAESLIEERPILTLVDRDMCMTYRGGKD